MAKDPAFLFYPGDYLRDTQCLSEATQVAYDRIMCEHMRNICTDMSNIVVSKAKHNFFTKRLTDEQKEELSTVLLEVGEDFQIEWVARSMAERKAYTDSRAKNRTKSKEIKEVKTQKTYDNHMEDENEIDNEDVIDNKKGIVKEKKSKEFVAPTLQDFKNYFIENEFSEQLAERAWKGYDSADWKDSQGKQIKNWKQKCQHVWFSDSNKQHRVAATVQSKSQTTLNVHDRVKQMLEEGGEG